MIGTPRSPNGTSLTA